MQEEVVLPLAINCKNCVLAISGGVDSMVLLDVVRRRHSPSDFVVAHLTHGVRSQAESDRDKQVITDYCRQYHLQCEYGEAHLTAQASEAEARAVRYSFLKEVAVMYNYNCIVTAHHQDDLVETAIINLLRGTAARGLVALSSRQEVLRPFIDVPKSDIVAYAQHHGLSWHEDSTNCDQRYLRNYIRSNIVPKLKQSDAYDQLLAVIAGVQPMQYEINTLLRKIEKQLIRPTAEGAQFSRHAFIMLDYVVAGEFVRHLYSIFDFGKPPTRQMIDVLVTFAKTARTGASIDMSSYAKLTVTRTDVLLNIRNRPQR